MRGGAGQTSGVRREEGLRERNEADSGKMSHESLDPISPQGHKGASFLFIAGRKTH